jgi:hypothetical protein
MNHHIDHEKSFAASAESISATAHQFYERSNHGSKDESHIMRNATL